LREQIWILIRILLCVCMKEALVYIFTYYTNFHFSERGGNEWRYPEREAPRKKEKPSPSYRNATIYHRSAVIRVSPMWGFQLKFALFVGVQTNVSLCFPILCTYHFFHRKSNLHNIFILYTYLTESVELWYLYLVHSVQCINQSRDSTWRHNYFYQFLNQIEKLMIKLYLIK
jgi:hypothetical protein